MKRYALFVGSLYYPCGGWSDLRGTYDTPEEALQAYRADTNDWYQIIDLQSGEEVAL